MRGHRAGTGLALVAGAALLAILIAAAPAGAHVTEKAGPYEVELGWGNEPPLTGLDNYVSVGVADAAGAPVAVPPGALSVEVTYGSATANLPLQPEEEPGELRAALVPTRPGTYAFRVSGTVGGRTLDVSARCSESTFECVGESAEAEFPARDPSAGQLAERLNRESARVEAASEDADSAKRTATIALALAAAALSGVLAILLSARRKRGRS